MLLRNTSSRRFLAWWREYFVFQSSGDCRTVPTIAFFCHLRVLAFNALSIFMWNCSADHHGTIFALPSPPLPWSLHVVNPALCTVWTVKRHGILSQELHVPIFFFFFSLCSTVSVFCSEMMNSKKFKVVLTKLHQVSEIICALLLQVITFQQWKKRTHRCIALSFESVSERCTETLLEQRLGFLTTQGVFISHVGAGWFAGCPPVLPVTETAARGVVDWSTFPWQEDSPSSCYMKCAVLSVKTIFMAMTQYG